MKKTEKILNLLTIVIFAGIIFLPLFNTFFKIIPEYKSNENREKAKKPIFAVGHITDFSSQFDDYYTDNFSLRENIIKNLHKFEYYFFNISPSPERVVVGKQGWFYAKKSESNYKGTNLFEPYELNQIKVDLLARTQWCENRGIKYYVAVIPNKMNVYPEYLPSNIIKLSQKSRYDQILELAKTPGLNIIDTRENILKHKNDGPILYQKTDDHWNELGAFYGYEKIMNVISNDFVNLHPYKLDSFEVSTKIIKGSIANLVNLADENPENFLFLNPKFTSFAKNGQKHGYSVPAGISQWDYEMVVNNEKAPDIKCLIIRDSFTLLLKKFFQEHFRKMVLIHDNWKYRLREDIIEIEKPDIVINIILETELHKLFENPFGKTVGYYYTRLKNGEKSFKMIQEKAVKNNLSVETMLKLDALWLFHNSTDNNKLKTLDYYRFLYATQDSLKAEIQQVL